MMTATRSAIVHRQTLAANTGTYLDTPAHRLRQGHDLSGLMLERCADLPTTVVRCRDLEGRSIETDRLGGVDIEGHAVLFDTGWDRHWGRNEYAGGLHPHLAEPTALTLLDRGVALVEIDSLNIDAADNGSRPIHTTLLTADILIVEHLTGLQALPERGARFFATPPLIDAMATFPVRAFAIV